MTQENAKLIAQELGSRLSYGVKIRVNDKIETVEGINILDNIVEFGTYMACDIDEVKPYLFPMSSMTEEQHTDMFNYYHNAEIEEVYASGDYLKAAYIGDDKKYEWLNRNHFDYRGLIEKGLAIDATGLGIY